MTRLTADLFPRRGRHPNRKTSEYSAIGSQSAERFVPRCVMGRLFESRAHCSGHACARGWLRASRGGAHQPSSSPGKMPGGITSVPGRAAARRPLAFCQ